MEICQENNPRPLILVEGIIGAGKTTVAQFLSKSLKLTLYEELGSAEEAKLTQNLLDRFYKTPDRWGALTQIFFLAKRFSDALSFLETTRGAIFDRSLYGDGVFAQTICKRGHMVEDEMAVYEKIRNLYLFQMPPPCLLLYINVDVDTAIRRIKQRNRSTEAADISREYMMDLKTNYDKWFDTFETCTKIKVNWDTSQVDENGELLESAKRKLLELIQNEEIGLGL